MNAALTSSWTCSWRMPSARAVKPLPSNERQSGKTVLKIIRCSVQRFLRIIKTGDQPDIIHVELINICEARKNSELFLGFDLKNGACTSITRSFLLIHILNIFLCFRLSHIDHPAGHLFSNTRKPLFSTTGRS